ncbi:MAG TPA: hypothetical protein DEA55_06500 [Rhodospirillaceae bacterium]|nr:hypothetical protein [Rhodospirillaceae bacterium]
MKKMNKGLAAAALLLSGQFAGCAGVNGDAVKHGGLVREGACNSENWTPGANILPETTTVATLSGREVLIYEPRMEASPGFRHTMHPTQVHIFDTDDEAKQWLGKTLEDNPDYVYAENYYDIRFVRQDCPLSQTSQPAAP